MLVYLWPSDILTLVAFYARVAEVHAAGDTPAYGLDTVEHLARLLYEEGEQEKEV